MVYAVLDTNVLVSSFITKNPESPTKKVVQMVLDGRVIPLYDEDVLSEYEEVLMRKKFRLDFSEVNAFITFIREYGIPSSRLPFDEPMPDESDRVFYEITLSVDDSFLVTGNLKHYPNKPQIVTPSEFLEIIR